MESVYDKYGGQDFWEEVFNRFYEFNLNDQILQSYYAGTDIERVKLMNRRLLCTALRPSTDHFPLSIKRIHQSMNINEHQFNIFVANLALTLREKGINDEDALEILNVIESFRGDVIKSA